MIGIDDVRAAAARIKGHVRHTPMLEASALGSPLTADAQVTLKLELLQVTGSFKARGATNRLLSMQPAELAKGIVAASGGNHGIATARAGRMAGVPTTIFLPTNASPAKIEKLKHWGAETRIVGSVWHEANAAALEFVARTGAAYFHPFADPYVVAGQGTVGLEILEQLPDVDTVLVAMGGGGLVSGVATAIKASRPSVRVIGIEAQGSAVLLRALEAGRNIGLDEVTPRSPPWPAPRPMTPFSRSSATRWMTSSWSMIPKCSAPPLPVSGAMCGARRCSRPARWGRSSPPTHRSP